MVVMGIFVSVWCQAEKLDKNGRCGWGSVSERAYYNLVTWLCMGTYEKGKGRVFRPDIVLILFFVL